MATTEVILVNDSDSFITLVNTSECQKGNKNSTYQGKPSYWKTPPPDVGPLATIKPHEELSVGSLESILYFDSPSWIYFSYADDKSKYQVFADLRWKGGILAQIGPYNSTSTEDNPMPSGARVDCIEYGYKHLPWVRIHIPPRRFWDFPPVDPKKAVAQTKSEETEQVVSILVGAALSTIIATCGVLPPAGLAAITVAERIAIGSTAVQGILGLFTSNGSNAGDIAFGPADAYNINRLALEEFKTDSFRVLLDAMQKRLNHANDNDDVTHRVTAIAQEVEKILHDSKDHITIDGWLLDQIKLCLDVFNEIVVPNGPFQVNLLSCLDQDLPTSTLMPSKPRISLGLAGLTMTLNAYTFGCTLRSFLALDTDPQSESSKMAQDLTRYSADTVIASLPKPGKFAHADRLLAYRMSLVNAECAHVISETPTWLRDSGLENCAWAAWSHEEANTWFRDWHWYPWGEYHDGQPVTWSVECSETGHHAQGTDTHRSAKRTDFVWTAYLRKMEELLSEDIAKVWNDPMATIADAFIPFQAQRARPVMPFEAVTVNKPLPTVAIANVSTAKLRFDGVQYGYSYVDSRDNEGAICWSNEVQPLSLADSSSAPAGFELTVPKDPDNARAEALAARTVAALNAGNVDVPQRPKPHYTSKFRKVYRKMRRASGGFAGPEVLPTMLDNTQGEVLVDQWPDGWILEPAS